MYGKFNNGVFIRAPRRMTEQEALAQGYKPVVLTPAPDTDNDHMPVESLEEAENEIIRHWTVVPVPIDPDPELSDEEVLNILLGGAE